MKAVGLIYTLTIVTSQLFAQCVADFSLTANADTLSATSLSSGSNLRTYWNFGDGRTSYELNPVHGYPESGRYLVTLYIYDTINGCHTFKDQWINITHPSTDPCMPYSEDTIINNQGTDYIYVSDYSSGCSQYHGNIDAGPAMNFSPNNWIGLWNWNSALFLTRSQYYVNDSTYGFALRREYYKTRPYNYSSSLNYDSCSANFEYYIEELPNGALVHLRAMNPFAQSYRFMLTGMGNPIILGNPETSFLYQYVSYEPYFPWLIGLETVDAGGCADTVWQQILIRNPNYTEPPNCIIASDIPGEKFVTENEDVQLIISAPAGANKQWYMDSGTGFTTLTNAGHFSGVNSDTLVISNVTLEMNNYHFRCDVTSNISGCGTSSNDCKLVVSNPDIIIYPNPATDYVTLIFPQPDTISEVTIYNSLGQKVAYFLAQGTSTTIDIGMYASGVYSVEIKSRKSVYRKKLVKRNDTR